MIQVMRVMLEMFFSTNGHNIQLAGIVLVTPSGRRIRIHVVINAFVLDEAAHKEIWGCKGASGLINCMLCKNHTLKGHGLQDAYFSECTQDAGEFDLHTDDTMRAVLRRLKREVDSGASNGAVETLEIKLGWNYDDENLLLNGERCTHT